MSRLSDVIHDIIETETDANGRLDVNDAAKKARDKLDDDDIESLILEALSKRIKSAVEKAKAAAADMPAEQASLPFPDMRPAYAVDTDGRYVVNTGDLSRVQFKRIIEIRKKQVADDTAHLKVLEAAYGNVTPIWDKHPDLTFGEVCNLYRKAAAA